MLYTIERVINNSVLNARDPQGRAFILTGRGIGFGHKPGETVPDTAVDRVYRMENSALQRKLLDLSEEIPYEHLALTDELVAHIRGALPYPLNESLLISLADHISFAVERASQGIYFTNPLMDSIRAFYGEEYRLGCWCLAQVRQRLNAKLIDDEAGFIALHIVNAELNTSMSTINEITRFVDGCVQVVEYYYDRSYDRDSLDFSRFALHLRFFAQRVFQGKTVPDAGGESDRAFREMVAKSCGTHYHCAKCIAEYVLKTWDKALSEEELIFLTMHLKRLNPEPKTE